MKKLASVLAIAAFCAFGGACAEDQPKNADPNMEEQSAADQVDGVTGASSDIKGPCEGKVHCPPPHRGPHAMPPMGHHPGMMPPMGHEMGQQPMLMGPIMYRANGYVIIIVPDQGYPQMPIGQMPGMMPPPAWNHPGMHPGMMPPPPPGAKFGPRHHGPKHCFKFNPDTGERNPDCKDGDRRHGGKGPHGPKHDGKK